MFSNEEIRHLEQLREYANWCYWSPDQNSVIPDDDRITAEKQLLAFTAHREANRELSRLISNGHNSDNPKIRI